MTTTNQIVAAVDIGTTKIVAIAGKKDELGKINILGYGEAESKGVNRGSVQNVGDVASAIKQAVAKCKAKSGVDFKNVFVGIAGQNVRGSINNHSKFIKNNIIAQADIDQLTQEVYSINKEPGEEIIHVIPQYFMVDGNFAGTNPVGCTGKRLEGSFYVAVGQANSVSNIRQAINMSGLNVIKIILEPLASAEAILTDDEKEAGVLVADIGGGNTDIAVFHDKVLRTTSYVPFGGNSITNDIKIASQTLQRQAEQLKIQYGSALSQAEFKKKLVTMKGIGGRPNKAVSLIDLANIINARVDEILGGIAYQIDNSDFKDKLSAGIVITGGGAQLKNLTQLVKFRLNMDVRIGSPRGVIVNDAQIASSKYTTAVGLIIKGIDYLDTYYKDQQRKESESASAGKQSSNEPSKVNESSKKSAEKKKSSGGLFARFKSWASDFLEDPEDSKM